MKSIFSYQDLNLLELEKNIQKEFHNGNYKSYFDLPDLQIVAMFGDLNKAKYLLLNGNANVDEKFNSSALYKACYYFGFLHNNYKIIQLLLDNKVSTNLKITNGQYEITVLRNLFDTYLLNNFKNQNNKLKFVYVFKILLNHGANINDQYENGYTILMSAVKNNKIDLVRILLDEKINIYIKNNKDENVFDQINKISQDESIVEVKRKIYDMLIKYKYNDSVFYLFECNDINIFFNKN